MRGSEKPVSSSHTYGTSVISVVRHETGKPNLQPNKRKEESRTTLVSSQAFMTIEEWPEKEEIVEAIREKTRKPKGKDT